MLLSSLRINHLSNEALAWYGRFIDAIQARDVDAFAAFLRDDCVIQVNDNFPVYGKVALFSSMARYYDMFGAVEHEILNLYGDDTHFAAELLCHYTPGIGGQRVTLPASVLYDRDEAGLIASVRLYVGAGGMFGAFTGTQR